MVKEGKKVKANSPKRFTDLAEFKAEEKAADRRMGNQSKYDIYDEDEDRNGSGGGSTADYKNEGKYSGDSK